MRRYGVPSGEHGTAPASFRIQMPNTEMNKVAGSLYQPMPLETGVMAFTEFRLSARIILSLDLTLMLTAYLNANKKQLALGRLRHPSTTNRAPYGITG